PALLLGQRPTGPREVADRHRLPLAPDPDGERRPLGRRVVPGQRVAVDREVDAPRVVPAQALVEERVEQRREVPLDRAGDEAGVEERRAVVAGGQPNARAVVGDEPGWRDPAPRGPLARRQPPDRRHVGLPASGLGDHLLAGEEPELDPDAREADPLAAYLGGGRDVMVAGQLPAL